MVLLIHSQHPKQDARKSCKQGQEQSSTLVFFPKAQGNQVTFLLSCANLVLKICSEAVMVFLSQTKPTTFSSLS